MGTQSPYARTRKAVAIVIFAATATLAAASQATSRTAIEACIDGAWAEANECFFAAGDSWLKGKACQVKLNFRLATCLLY